MEGVWHTGNMAGQGSFGLGYTGTFLLTSAYEILFINAEGSI